MVMRALALDVTQVASFYGREMDPRTKPSMRSNSTVACCPSNGGPSHVGKKSHVTDEGSVMAAVAEVAAVLWAILRYWFASAAWEELQLLCAV